MLLGEVKNALLRHGALAPGLDDPVLVACSGGVDSVVLAHAASALLGGRRVVLGHVDHGVRADSAEDARFVRSVAQGLNVDSLHTRVSPRSDAEAALREARYEALEAQRIQAQACFTLTAHTEDDQAESVLIGLVRSGHPESLLGIPEQRARILRPMLGVSRKAVTEYARKHRLIWREDLSNREPRYLRNRIRKELLPLLETRYRAGTKKRLAALARTLFASSRVNQEGRAPKAPPKEVYDYPSLPKPSPKGPTILMRCEPWNGGAIPQGRQTAYFDADALPSPMVRLFQAGDRIQPFGMEGRTKVTEVLRAARISSEHRASYPVVVDQTGAVMWVPGVIRSAFAPVGDETSKVWVFSMKEVRK